MRADASEQAKQEKVKVLINFKCHICMRWFMKYNTKTENKDDLDSFWKLNFSYPWTHAA